MADREDVLMVLAPGERRQLVVLVSSTVLVVAGRVLLRGPGQWLAETLVVNDQWLDAEQIAVMASAGWVELVAPGGAQLMLTTPRRTPWWRLIRAPIASGFARWVSASVFGGSVAGPIRLRWQTRRGVARFADRK